MSLAAWLNRLAASPEFTAFTRRIENAGRAFNRWVDENRDQIALVSLNIELGYAYFITSLRDLPPRYLPLVEPGIIGPIVEHGWYPDPDDSLGGLELLARVFTERVDPEDGERAGAATNADEARRNGDRLMCEKTRDRLDDIEADLLAAFPSRSPILQEAFEAHRQAMFNLSVPVLIAQADGIWHDRCQKSPFSKERRKAVPQIISHPNARTAAPLARALLGGRWPLALNTRQRRPEFSDLNRHQVLHGEDTDYGTELNSLKAVSFIRFCGFVLSDMTEDAEGDTSRLAA